VNARIRAVFDEYVDWNVETPSGRVKCDCVLKTSSGSRNWFQLVPGCYA
jgi:hypothetical protein